MKMFNIVQLLLLLLLQIHLINSSNTSSCIPNTPCQCYLSKYSLTLWNCSQTLSDLPIFNWRNTQNITRIIARNAFHQWPIQLCKYSNIQILDLSGSDFHSQVVDLGCLNHLIHLNLSNSKLQQIPSMKNTSVNHLQILDLSNNQIKILDGNYFQVLTNLISLFLQNNPIGSIEHVEYFFNLTNLQSINLISSDVNIQLKSSLTIDQWINLAIQWKNISKSFLIRMNHIPFQSIIPHPNQFELISSDLMKIILKNFLNSTFLTLFHTPKCNCIDLRKYQRIFSLIDYQKKYSSPLFQSTKCLMTDGMTHARLFDRRTTVDLRCPVLGKISFFPGLYSSSSILNSTFLSVFLLLCLVF